MATGGIAKNDILTESAPHYPLTANWAGGNKRGKDAISARESSYIRRECAIQLTIDFNPKSGKSMLAFAEYRDGWTVSQFCNRLLEKGIVATEKGALDHIAWDYNHNFINLIPYVYQYLDMQQMGSDASRSADDALVDFPESGPTDRALSVSYKYKRDPAIRAAALKRANGKCEYCKERGFIDAAGHEYLESHHIIALAKQGADTMQNVIALCANHHREAHFGKDAEALEAKMTEIILKMERA